MNFEEVKLILKRLFKEHVKKHMKRILVALVLSLIVAGSTSGIAWLLDPAVKKIFIEQNEVFAWTIPILIVVALIFGEFQYFWKFEKKILKRIKIIK